MPIQIKTENQTENRGLSISEMDNLISLVYRSDYTSYFHFAYWDNTKNGKFVGYGGSLCSADTEENFFDDGLPKNVDVYICPNGMKSPYKRTTDKLISIQNLVIDIDSHDESNDYDELNKHILQIQNILIDNLIIKPNLVNRTGRGLHLWYWIDPCHVSLNKICLNVIDMLCANIQDILNKTDTKLSIDKASSMKLGGLFRLPYSYNTRAKRWSEAELIHEDLPNINELKTILNDNGYVSEIISNEKKPRKKKLTQYKFSPKVKENNYTPYLIKRKRFMDYIYKKGDHNKRRNVIIFGMYSTLIWLMEQEDAENYCLEMNDGFDEPLPYSEIIATFNQVNKKRYRIPIKKFMKNINATEEEIQWYEKYSAKEAKKRATRQRKEERNAKVIELYNQGTSIVSINKQTGISRPTIYKIINENIKDM